MKQVPVTVYSTQDIAEIFYWKEVDADSIITEFVIDTKEHDIFCEDDTFYLTRSAVERIIQYLSNADKEDILLNLVKNNLFEKKEEVN